LNRRGSGTFLFNLLIEHVYATGDLVVLRVVGPPSQVGLQGLNGLMLVAVQLVGARKIEEQRDCGAVTPKGVLPVNDSALVVGLVEGGLASLKGTLCRGNVPVCGFRAAIGVLPQLTALRRPNAGGRDDGGPD
jgi:hypothetical protein